MSSNNQTNGLIKWAVILGDFVILNALVWTLRLWHPLLSGWSWESMRFLVLASNMAMMASETRFYTLIHRRSVAMSDILPRLICLVGIQTLLAYLLMRVIDFHLPAGHVLLPLGVTLFVVLTVARFVERSLVKAYRQSGRNTRSVTLVGDDPELESVRQKLMDDATLGYRILSEYRDAKAFADLVGSGQELELGDELYLCVSRREKKLVKQVSHLCEQRVVWFYYVPVSVESLDINLKREMLDDIEVFAAYESPLQNPVNKAVKRAFDIVVSFIALMLTGLLFPLIYLIIKIQSPGPIFFRQLRTGLDGRDFLCYKFRSMHVNRDADRVQATKDDPRKFPFGNLMRKANIDELPQFWNVLRGSMSVVGPRPHMLAHTEMYSRLIDKYMVRHFVKPGVTGWAQVTGYRGETRELWQMEGRVRRDIWYMEHWSIWLDIRIIWLTVKTIFVHDKNAY